MAVKLFELRMAGAVVVVISIGDDAANYPSCWETPHGRRRRRGGEAGKSEVKPDPSGSSVGP